MHRTQYKNVVMKDHHLPRSGRRGSFEKKHGAGKNNWGTIEEDGSSEVIDYFSNR